MTDHASTRSRLPDVGAGFVWDTTDGVVLLRPDAGDLVAAFTTRVGGVSPVPWDTLNLSRSSDDDAGHVDENRRRASAATGTATDWLGVHQVHGGEVVGAADAGREADAIWTDSSSQTVAVLAADCVPVLLAGDAAIAAAHAGWRGMLAGVVANAAKAVHANRAWIGPAIGPCCYEVGPEVSTGFEARHLVNGSRLDLWSAASEQAWGAGVREVCVAGLCNACHPDLFFSHRRDRGLTGRQALLARPA